MASNSGPVRCAFCEQGHASSSCTVVTDVSARKEALRKSGRCYVCLRKGHISRDCRSTGCCNKCRGRHHSTVSPRRGESTGNPSVMLPGPVTEGQEGASQASGGAYRPTNVAYVDSRTPILLQTARLQLYSPSDTTSPPTCVRGQSSHG